MFKSLKQLIEQRLGGLIVRDDLSLDDGYFIKIEPAHLNPTLYFLKHDPDTRLGILDHIISINAGLLPWKNPPYNPKASWEIIYQLKSIYLPYRINIAIEVEKDGIIIPTISPLYSAACWIEDDLSQELNIEFEENYSEVF